VVATDWQEDIGLKSRIFCVFSPRTKVRGNRRKCNDLVPVVPLRRTAGKSILTRLIVQLISHPDSGTSICRDDGYKAFIISSIAPGLTSHIQEGFNPPDINILYYLQLPRVLTSHIQEGLNPPDINVLHYLQLPRVSTSHIQEGFNPTDIQASYIPVAPGFNPGE